MLGIMEFPPSDSCDKDYIYETDCKDSSDEYDLDYDPEKEVEDSDTSRQCYQCRHTVSK